MQLDTHMCTFLASTSLLSDHARGSGRVGFVRRSSHACSRTSLWCASSALALQVAVLVRRLDEVVDDTGLDARVTSVAHDVKLGARPRLVKVVGWREEGMQEKERTEGRAAERRKMRQAGWNRTTYTIHSIHPLALCAHSCVSDRSWPGRPCRTVPAR